jgi:hypothetical protein
MSEGTSQGQRGGPTPISNDDGDICKKERYWLRSKDPLSLEASLDMKYVVQFATTPQYEHTKSYIGMPRPKVL